MALPVWPVAFAVNAPASAPLPEMFPDLVKPVPLTVINWPGEAVAGTTVRTRLITSRLKVADLVPAFDSLMVIKWVPVAVPIGTLNLYGSKAPELPVASALIVNKPPTVGTWFTTAVPEISTPVAALLLMILLVAEAVKSIRSTVTTPPGTAEADRGMAPAF
jgi:hypothetical protein